MLRTVFQAQEDKLMKFLKAGKSLYSVAVKTAASQASGKLGPVNVDTMLEQLGERTLF